jgi:hypothetical protein
MALEVVISYLKRLSTLLRIEVLSKKKRKPFGSHMRKKMRLDLGLGGSGVPSGGIRSSGPMKETTGRRSPGEKRRGFVSKRVFEKHCGCEGGRVGFGNTQT